MPALNNKRKHTFHKIEIRYEKDAYDVFTEGTRMLLGEVPEDLYVKCFGCKKKTKIIKNIFGPSDFILNCSCRAHILVRCLRAKEDYFNIYM